MGEREKFLNLYNNLPIKLRSEVVLVLRNKEPITWNVAYGEISNNTPLGEEILKGLVELKII